MNGAIAAVIVAFIAGILAGVFLAITSASYIERRRLVKETLKTIAVLTRAKSDN